MNGVIKYDTWRVHGIAIDTLFSKIKILRYALENKDFKDDILFNIEDCLIDITDQFETVKDDFNNLSTIH